MIKNFTQSYIQSLKPDDRPYTVTDSACHGLYVYVGKSKKTYYLKYLDKDDKQHKHKIGEAGDVLTVVQARTIANQLKSSITLGESIEPEKPASRLKLGEFMNGIYTPERLMSNPKAGQLTLNMMRSVFSERFYSCYIDALDIKDFNAWRNDRLSVGVKRVTVNKNIIALRAALKWGVENGYFASNPLQNMKLLKETDAASKVRYLTDDERTRLLAALDEREARMRDARNSHNEWRAERDLPARPELDDVFADHLKPMVLLSLYCGIRRGTLLGLLWGDMNFAAEILTMRGEIMKGGEILRVPVNSIVLNTLAAWRNQSGNIAPDDLVFPSPRTGEMLKDVKKAWRGVLESARIDNFRWHDMRHDFASQLVMKGIDLNTVRELMGHKDITTTQIYAHLAPEHKLRAVEVLAADFGSKISIAPEIASPA
ncbi:MAG: site-specific integrase [Holosporales bacterium]|nr:site-specific integrase [Holosporales bacterium]